MTAVILKGIGIFSVVSVHHRGLSRSMLHMPFYLLRNGTYLD